MPFPPCIHATLKPHSDLHTCRSEAVCFFVVGWKKNLETFFCFVFFFVVGIFRFCFFCFWLKVDKAHKSGLARTKHGANLAESRTISNHPQIRRDKCGKKNEPLAASLSLQHLHLLRKPMGFPYEDEAEQHDQEEAKAVARRGWEAWNRDGLPRRP